MKQSKFSTTRKSSSLDGRTIFIYIILLCFSLCWIFAVIKVLLLESARTKPISISHGSETGVVVVGNPTNGNNGNNGGNNDNNGNSNNGNNMNNNLLIKEPTRPPIILRRAPNTPDTVVVPPPPPVRVDVAPKMSLKWPPVLPDGTIPTEDGYDVMTLTDLKVPKFWTPDDSIPLEKQGEIINGVETIFLMIASYRDFQCRETITSAFMRADHPEALFIGAVDQITEGDIGCTTLDVSCEEDPNQMICKYWNQISVYKMDAEIATGPVTARHIGDRLYRGQYFVMQMDAHCHFVRHWDTQIKDQWRLTKNEMAVLSSYLTDYQGSIDANGDSTRDTRPIMCNSAFEGMMPARYLRHGSQPEDYAAIREMPQLQPFWAAGFSFSRGHFKVRVPYDGYQPMVFQGEEISIGIRGFTFGYDYYAPRDSVVFHEYAERSNRRKKIHMFWENSPKHQGEAKGSLARSMAIIKMSPDIPDDQWNHAEEKKYGIGSVRSLDLFYQLFLIDTINRESVQLCPFVKNGGMHREFQKYLRPDGLGIDYSYLTEFKTRDFLEGIFQKQRPGGEKMIETAIKNKKVYELETALENARRIGLDKSNPTLYKKGLAAVKNNFGSA